MVGRTHQSDPQTERALARHFRPLIEAMDFTCLDIGARGGATLDVRPLARACRVVGFEPDVAECDRLNAGATANSHGWASLIYVPVALGFQHAEARPLHLYAKAGCTSLLEGDRAVAGQFQRAHYFDLQGTVPLTTKPLDLAAAEFGFERADFMKIDIQGAELEVFESGERLMSDLLAVRTEVAFLPLYQGQPLFSDIDACLRRFGLLPRFFPEMQSWRRETTEKSHRLAQGEFPYSRGELVHADVVYFRAPAGMPCATEAEQDRLIRLALLALCYDLVDLAVAAFRIPSVRSRAHSLLHGDPLKAASQFSHALARHRRKSPFSRRMIHV